MKKKSKIEYFGKKTVKVLDTFSSVVVAIVLLLLLCYGAYATWDGRQVSADAGMENYQAYKPNVETKYSFEELQKMNKDVFSWLTVYGTGIDYPVVQGKDNDEYVNKDATGNYRMSGSLFLDYRNQKNYSDFNSIIFGHHMAEHAMFGDLDKFLEKQYFDEHKYGNLFFQGKDHGIEFFAMLDVDAFDNEIYYTPITEKSAQEAYLKTIYQKAKFSRKIGVTNHDRLLLLSTCSSDTTNGRHVLIGRIINQKIAIPKSLADQNPINRGKNILTEKGASILGMVGRKPIMMFLLYILLLLLLFFIYNSLRKKRLKRQERREAPRES